MKRSSVSLFAAVLGFLLVGGARVAAGPITWSYWGAGGPPAGGDTVYASGNALPQDAADGVQMIAVPFYTNSIQKAGSSNIALVQLQTFFESGSQDPGFFLNPGYQLWLHLEDHASHAWGQLTFAGVFNGWISPTEAHLTSTFTGPTTQSLSLGDNLYTVTLGPYVPPGPPNIPYIPAFLPNASPLGSIGAHVSVQPSGLKPTPEPSTMVLAALGLTCCGLWAGRRWQSRRRMALGLT